MPTIDSALLRKNVGWRENEDRKAVGPAQGRHRSPPGSHFVANTIAHTVGAAGVGAQAASVFGHGYFGIISAVLTVLILFVSEIIPKTLGAVYWKRLAGITAVCCELLIVGLLPLVWISEQLTDFFKPKGRIEAIMNRDELVALAELSFKEGVIAEKESAMIRNLLRFHNVRVEDITTPRTVAAKVPESMTCGDVIKDGSVIRFSRILVHSEDYDDITGYVLKQRILEEVAFDRHSTLIADIKCPIRIVSAQASLSNLFRDLIDHNEQIALVVDEYGTISGLVTNEDLIETLLGLEIVDESDQVVDMREFARQKWRERAGRMGIGPIDASQEE